jgi:hypothetical protein
VRPLSFLLNNQQATTFYGTVGTVFLASDQPLRKAYYLNKWPNKTDDLLKSEMQAGKLYLTPYILTPNPSKMEFASYHIFIYSGI